MTTPPPLKALKAFEAVVRFNGFSRAADELHVTQSAISHQVTGLEAWMGRPLFDRSGNRPKPLKDAVELADALSVAFARIDTACERLRNPASGNHLTIAVIPSVATCWLIPRLSAFRETHPDITLRVMYAIHGQPVDFTASDLAINYAPTPLDMAAVQATRLLSGASAPVCSHGFLEANGPLDQPERIAAAGLLHDTNLSGWQQWLDPVSEHPITLPQGPVYEDFNLLRAAALAGQGSALCPLSVIADDLEGGRLVQLSDRTVHDDSAYYLVERGGSAGSTAPVATFRDWLVRQGDGCGGL